MPVLAPADKVILFWQKDSKPLPPYSAAFDRVDASQ